MDNRTEEERNREKYRESRKEHMKRTQSKSGFLTFILAMMPGAGHMYLGYMNKGIVIMSVFLILTGFTGWLSLPLIGFIIPVIWFYSVFDALRLRNYPGEDLDDLSELLPEISPVINSKYVGWGLIAFGVLIIVQKIVMPRLEMILTWEIRNMIQTIIVSGIFILGGFKLISLNKDDKSEEDDYIDEEEYVEKDGYEDEE